MAKFRRVSKSGGVTKGRVGLNVEGYAEVLGNLRERMDRQTGTEAKKVFRKAALILKAKAREYAPYDDGRKTGTHLRDAIWLGDPHKHKPFVFVGVDARKAPHFHWMEFGNARIGKRGPSKGYMRRAIKDTKDQMAQIIGTGLKALIEK